jgi:TPR repeat protein
MRIFAGVIALVLSLTLPYHQELQNPQCMIQALAIEAALGDPMAQHNLGVAFHVGKDLPQDFSKSAILWRLSSNAGVRESQNNLGHLLYYGRGVKQNYAEGIQLWREAAENGFAESQLHLASAYTDGRFLNRDDVKAYAWAKAGKHFAPQNPELEKAHDEQAEKLLRNLRGRMTKAQMAEAETKAAEYIARYAPKTR